MAAILPQGLKKERESDTGEVRVGEAMLTLAGSSASYWSGGFGAGDGWA
jgi:hypothetical protein